MENVLTNEGINIITRDLVRARNNLRHLSTKDITFVVAGEVINGGNHHAYSLDEFKSYCYHVLGMGIDESPLDKEVRESLAELILKGIVKPVIKPGGSITYTLADQDHE